MAHSELSNGATRAPEQLSEVSVWLSWFPHTRTTSICAHWQIPLEIYDGAGLDGIFRRLKQACMTVKRLVGAKEKLVFVQNPSLGLTLIACSVRIFRKFKLVIDAHNEGVRPFNRSGLLIRILTKWIIRITDLTVVTNEELALDIRRAGGVAVVLPDPLPDLVDCESVQFNNDASPGSKVFVVATYARDEPIVEILDAATRLGPCVKFIFSGNEKKLDSALVRGAPVNVLFAGFLSEAAFFGMMRTASCVLDLSLKPDCLVCGAYEALALGRPVILTRSAAAMRLFDEGVEFVDNSAKEICRAVQKIIEHQEDFDVAAVHCAERYRSRWRQYADTAELKFMALSGFGTLASD